MAHLSLPHEPCLPSEAQGPEPSQMLGAQPWPARTMQPSQSRIPAAEVDGDGLCREQKTAVRAGGRGRPGSRGYGPALTTSVARAQYKGAGPLPVHLALGVLGPRGLPKLSPREEGQGASLA